MAKNDDDDAATLAKASKEYVSICSLLVAKRTGKVDMSSTTVLAVKGVMAAVEDLGNYLRDNRKDDTDDKK